MEFEIYDAAMLFCNYCTGATFLATVIALSFFWMCQTRQVNIYRRVSNENLAEKRYIIVYVLSNLVDSIVYNVTYVSTFGWDNSLVLFADGYFGGPRAIGIHMIASTTPAAILALLNFYRYAQMTNFTRFEFLSSSFSIIYCSFWLSLNALFHYSVPTILFQTDGDAIDQTADLFHWILDRGRDYGFEQCVGTYWIDGTFRNGKWKPITGLGMLFFSNISALVVNIYISYKIRNIERSRNVVQLSSTTYSRYEPRHNLMLWSQLLIVSFTVSLPRLIIALIPFVHESNRGEFDANFAYFTQFSVPLRPILTNFAVIIVIRYQCGCTFVTDSSQISVVIVTPLAFEDILCLGDSVIFTSQIPDEMMSNDFAQVLTVCTTIPLVGGLFNQKMYNFRFYRYYLLAYVINNCLDSVVYQFTLVYSVVTRNTFVLMATGLFEGPKAIGIHLIVSQQTFTLISFLFCFRFCMHCSPNMHEILCHRSAIVYHSFWIAVNALLSYSIPALFFLPDADSIQQVFALLTNMLQVPRDNANSMTLGTYWASDTFIGLKPKPILGLGILYFLTFMSTFWALFFTWKIMKTVRSTNWHSYSSRKDVLEKEHLFSLWLQFLIAFLPLVFCRLAWATVPFFSRIYNYNLLNFAFGYTVLYGLPLRPLVANIALLITVKEIRVGFMACFGCSDQRIMNVQSTESSHA